MAKATLSLLVLVLAACSAKPGGPAAPEGAESSSSKPRPAEPGAAVLLPRLEGSAVGDSAALQGRLATAGPCLYVDTGAGRYLVAALSPSLTWDAGSNRLRSGAAALAVGDELLLGGSQAGPGAPLAWTVEPHSSCDRQRIWIATSAAPR